MLHAHARPRQPPPHTHCAPTCSMQGVIEHALSTILRESRETLCVCAAGRTDAGVHAKGQVWQGCVCSQAG